MENFNPSNPEYKKVEDLPKEEQARFVNVQDGFVRKTAYESFEEIKKDEKESRKSSSFFVNLVQELTATKDKEEIAKKALDFLLGEILSEKGYSYYSYGLTRKARHIEEGILDEDFKIKQIKGSVLTSLEVFRVTALEEIKKESQEALQILGHTGCLYYERCTRNCERIQGDIDGKGIDVHTDGGGGSIKIDGNWVRIEGQESIELFTKYRNCAIDLDRIHNLNNGLILITDAIEKEDFDKIQHTIHSPKVAFSNVKISGEILATIDDFADRLIAKQNALNTFDREQEMFDQKEQEQMSGNIRLRNALDSLKK
jgi:hypothetical protein